MIEVTQRFLVEFHAGRFHREHLDRKLRSHSAFIAEPRRLREVVFDLDIPLCDVRPLCDLWLPFPWVLVSLGIWLVSIQAR